MLPVINTPLKDKPTNLMTVQRFDKLVPIIGNSLRETKSTGPLNAMVKLSINAKLLVLEIAAVRIQSLIRKHLAIKRVKLIRHHVKLYLEITSSFCERVVEEVVLAGSFEVSLGLIKSHRRYQLLKAIVETEMIDVIDEIIMEEVQVKSHEVVVETLTEVTNYFIARRPRKPETQKYNLLLALMSNLTDEVADTFMRAVTIEAIEEEVREYLRNTYAKYIFEWLANDIIFELTKPALVDAILAEGMYDRRNFTVVNMVDILRTSGDNNTDSIYFPLHTFHQEQLRHGMNGQVLEVQQIEMDRAISSMSFMNFINEKMKSIALEVAQDEIAKIDETL